MYTSRMDLDAHVHHWFSAAQHELDTADVLLEEFRSFDCLVYLQHCVEKMAKGLWVLKKREHPPATWNVLFLLHSLGIEPPEDHLALIMDLTTVRTKTQWPYEVKLFRQNLNAELAKETLEKTEALIRWLKTLTT